MALLAEPRWALFRDQAPQHAYEQLNALLADKALAPPARHAASDLAGFALIALKDYAEAARMFESIGNHYLAGYAHLLRGDLYAVHNHWRKVLALRENHWAVTLYGLVTRQLNTYPTFLQIRNHVETDVAFLIAAGQLNYLENYLGYLEFLGQLNLEAFKLVGRALMYAGWQQRAGPILMQGQKACPHDPEVYYHLAQYSLLQNAPADARLLLKQCLMINAHYTPASELLAQVGEG